MGFIIDLISIILIGCIVLIALPLLVGVVIATFLCFSGWAYLLIVISPLIILWVIVGIVYYIL